MAELRGGFKVAADRKFQRPSQPLVCPRCGRAMRILAFVTQAASVRRILAHIGEATSPPAGTESAP